MKKVFIGSDHGGYELKEEIVTFLRKEGYQVSDYGCYSSDPVDYPEKLDCCGAMIHTNLPESALTKTGQKLASVQDQGFDIFVDTCPWCHRMFDSKQKKAGDIVASKLNIPVVYLTQILGLSFGIDTKKLGFDLNLSPTEKIVEEG